MGVQVKPRVSVLMPVHNGERFLREAVESILDQDYADFEFIIVDDGSTDNTAEILGTYSDPRIVCLSHKTNLGIVHALNCGLETARGELIARQDADDVSLPHRLEQQVRLLDQRPDVVIVGSSCHMIDDAGVRIGICRFPVSDTAIHWLMLFHNGFAHTSVMLRAGVLHQHALRYDERLSTSQDYDLWSRLLHHGLGMNIAQPLVKRRAHAEQVSRTSAIQQRCFADRIARSNLEQIGVRLSDAEVSALRNWYHHFPRRLRGQDVALCRALLRTLDAFGRQQNVDPRLMRDIRALWVGRILAAASAGLRMDLWRTGLFRDILRQVTPYTLVYLSRWAIRLMMKGITHGLPVD